VYIPGAGGVFSPQTRLSAPDTYIHIYPHNAPQIPVLPKRIKNRKSAIPFFLTFFGIDKFFSYIYTKAIA